MCWDWGLHGEKQPSLWGNHFSGVLLFELSVTFGMLAKILFDYLSSRCLAFLLWVWPLWHVYSLPFLFPIYHTPELSPPQTHEQSHPSSHPLCHDINTQLLRTCLLLHWFTDLGRWANYWLMLLHIILTMP